MSIDGILKKISAEADAQIAALEAENRATIEELKAEAEAKITTIKTEAKSRAEAEKQRAFEQTLSREEAKLRVELLAEKQRIVDEVFERARARILGLPPDELRKRYLAHLKSFGEKSGTIIVGAKDDTLLDAGFIKSAGEALGGSFNRELATDFDHGLILIAGKIRYDARFDELFNEIIEGKTDEVAAMLFSGEGQ